MLRKVILTKSLSLVLSSIFRIFFNKLLIWINPNRISATEELTCLYLLRKFMRVLFQFTNIISVIFCLPNLKLIFLTLHETNKIYFKSLSVAFVFGLPLLVTRHLWSASGVINMLWEFKSIEPCSRSLLHAFESSEVHDY